MRATDRSTMKFKVGKLGRAKNVSFAEALNSNDFWRAEFEKREFHVAVSDDLKQACRQYRREWLKYSLRRKLLSSVQIATSVALSPFGASDYSIRWNQIDGEMTLTKQDLRECLVEAIGLSLDYLKWNRYQGKWESKNVSLSCKVFFAFESVQLNRVDNVYVLSFRFSRSILRTLERDIQLIRWMQLQVRQRKLRRSRQSAVQ